MESSFQRIMTDMMHQHRESLTAMQAMVTNNHEGGTSTFEQESRRTEGSQRRENQPQPHHQHREDHTQRQHRSVKLEFPKFRGEDPTAWISKAKQYFYYQAIAPEHRVSFASYHLEDEANEWWQATSKTLREHNHFINWGIFEEELWARFGPTEGEDFDEALSKIQQKGSLRDYHREFERLQNKVDGWTEKALIGTYMGGLHDAIADSVRMFWPRSLKEAIGLARQKDEQLQRIKRSPTYGSYSNRNYRETGVTNPRSDSSPNTTPSSTTRKLQTSKRLSWDELKKKHSLGLCFSCDERFTPGHRCRKPQLLLMEGEGEIEDDDPHTTTATKEPEISVEALTGGSSPKTIRATTVINQQSVIVLIDSGSTHNFIDSKMANQLNLQITATKPFNVRVADGNNLHCRGVYRKVAMELAGVIFSTDMFAVALNGLDLVLGIHWLETLGPTICDWKAQSIQFHWAGQQRCIHGLRASPISSTLPNDFAKAAQESHTILALHIQKQSDDTSPVPPHIQPLLQEFSAVFSTPSTLSPPRSIEHRIILKEGSDPINVRPYRYAYFQKDEIEKQVQEMLTSGLLS